MTARNDRARKPRKVVAAARKQRNPRKLPAARRKRETAEREQPNQVGELAMGRVPPGPLHSELGVYLGELSPDEQAFMAALAEREDLVEEIKLLRLALLRAKNSQAGLSALVTGARAVERLVNTQNRLGSISDRELEQALSKALELLDQGRRTNDES